MKSMLFFSYLFLLIDRFDSNISKAFVFFLLVIDRFYWKEIKLNKSNDREIKWKAIDDVVQ